MRSKQKTRREERGIPLFGRDEMNLVEIPFGPITDPGTKTMEIINTVVDRKTKRKVNRKLVITGSDAFGLPKPIDDQILIGLKTLTCEQGMNSPKVMFSRHELCRILGMNPDGRAYKRIEDSLDRIAGTTLKFKDSWWDKGEQEWRSHTFHLITNVEICSKDRYQKIRAKTKTTRQQLCSFVWNEVIWKSLQDGYIRKLDMEMFRRIANGRRREVPVRLFRILGKRLWKKQAVTLNLEKLCIGMLGLHSKYPSRMRATIERAALVLVDAGFIGRFAISKHNVTFYKQWAYVVENKVSPKTKGTSELRDWFLAQDPRKLLEAERAALTERFGSRFEQNHVRDHLGSDFSSSMCIRILYVRRYLHPKELATRSTVAA